MKKQIPIYIISLHRTPERRLYIQRQLDSLGLKYQFVDVDAIDKYKLESKAYRSSIAKSLEIDEATLEDKYAMIGSTTGAAKGQLAIMLSHIKIYDLMIKNDHSEVCILEDDATLLPTFPEVLKAAPELSWDILHLAHQPMNRQVMRILNILYVHKPKSNSLYLRNLYPLLSLLLRGWIRSHTNVNKNAIQHAMRLYNFDNRLYPAHSKYILETLNAYQLEHRKFAKKIIFLLILEVIRYLIMKAIRQPYSRSQQLARIPRNYAMLNLCTAIKLGEPGVKDSLAPITDNCCITPPLTLPLSATAYLVRQSAAAKWKQKVLAKNMLVIDQAPAELYKNKQVKLCLVSPPCATATYSYLKYSTRTS